jgi:hypothetical protein
MARPPQLADKKIAIGNADKTGEKLPNLVASLLVMNRKPNKSHGTNHVNVLFQSLEHINPPLPLRHTSQAKPKTASKPETA